MILASFIDQIIGTLVCGFGLMMFLIIGLVVLAGQVLTKSPTARQAAAKGGVHLAGKILSKWLG